MQQQAAWWACSTLHIPEHTRASSELHSGGQRAGITSAPANPQRAHVTSVAPVTLPLFAGLPLHV